MPDQSFHATARRPRRPGLSQALPLSRLVTDADLWLCRQPGHGDRLRSLVAQEPNAVAEPQMCRRAERFSPVGQPWPGSRAGSPRAEPGRPGSHSAGCSSGSGTQPPHSALGSQPVSEPARPYQGIASPFDPTQFRLPTLGLPPGLGTPEPTPEIKARIRAIRRARDCPENTIQVVVGRAKVIVLREKPRRIYIPDETVAGFQIVTDQQFAVVGKKIGRTVLNLWFPDPRNPNDPNRDRTLATWSSSCPIRNARHLMYCKKGSV